MNRNAFQENKHQVGLIDNDVEKDDSAMDVNWSVRPICQDVDTSNIPVPTQLFTNHAASDDSRDPDDITPIVVQPIGDLMGEATAAPNVSITNSEPIPFSSAGNRTNSTPIPVPNLSSLSIKEMLANKVNEIRSKELGKDGGKIDGMPEIVIGVISMPVDASGASKVSLHTLSN